MAVAATVGALALGAAACSSSPTNSTTTTTQAATGSGSPTTSGSSNTAATVKVSSNATFGNILVNSAGLALYTYSPDKGHNGMATCTGGCLSVWPALTVPAGTNPTAGSGVGGTLAAVKQANGTYQVTYNGMPLYTFAQDSGSQVTGNGVNNFSVAKASGSSSSSGGAGGSTTASTSSGGYQY